MADLAGEFRNLMSGVLADSIKRELSAKFGYLYSKKDLAALQALFSELGDIREAVTQAESPAEGLLGKKMYARVRAFSRAVDLAGKTREDYWSDARMSAENDVVYYSASLDQYLSLHKLYVERDSLPEGEETYLDTVVSDPVTGADREAGEDG